MVTLYEIMLHMNPCLICLLLQREAVPSPRYMCGSLRFFCHASDSNKNLKFDGVTIVNENS